MGLIADYVQLAMRKQKVDSKAAIARLLEVGNNRLSEWSAGSRTCPLPRVMDLARLAGRDPGKAVVAYQEELTSTK